MLPALKIKNMTIEEKAKEYDKVIAILEEAYECDDMGELIHEDKDLGWIGEKVAYALGYMM